MVRSAKTMKKSAKWLALAVFITMLVPGFVSRDVRANQIGGQISDTDVGIKAYTDVTDFGASSKKTREENKQALQKAIAHVDSQGGGVIIVPVTVEYGYSRKDVSTHPDFTNTDTNITVIDYSKGNTPWSNPLARDGNQVRYFSSTEGDEKNGQHDGNTTWFMSKWHPALMIMHNDATANNRRATVFFGNRGEVNWGIGQGTNTINGGTDDELSDFKITGNKVAGSPSLSTMFTIKKISGFFGWNVGSPSKEFHFVGRQADTDFLIHQGKTGGDVNLMLKTKSHLRTFKLEEDNGDLIITKSDGTGTAVRLSKDGNAAFEKGVSGGAFNAGNLPAASSVPVGTMVFHTDLNKPVWSNGTHWVDANGSLV